LDEAANFVEKASNSDRAKSSRVSSAAPQWAAYKKEVFDKVRGRQLIDQAQALFEAKQLCRGPAIFFAADSEFVCRNGGAAALSVRLSKLCAGGRKKSFLPKASVFTKRDLHLSESLCEWLACRTDEPNSVQIEKDHRTRRFTCIPPVTSSVCLGSCQWFS